MSKIKLENLHAFAVKALLDAGMREADAQTVADTLITTDTFGVMTHGTKNLAAYIEKMRAGGLDAKAVPTVECEGPAFAVINGNRAVGMVSACMAMNLAVKKAKEVGIAYGRR